MSDLVKVEDLVAAVDAVRSEEERRTASEALADAKVTVALGAPHDAPPAGLREALARGPQRPAKAVEPPAGWARGVRTFRLVRDWDPTE